MQEWASSPSRLRGLVLGAGAVCIWLCVGFSLGWYYTFTYYGRVGWPMPMPEPCAALVLYYFSVLNVETEVQAVHWLLVFPLAGFLWALTLQWSARWFVEIIPPWSTLFTKLSLAAIPLALPGPWMAWIAGRQNGLFTWDRMMLVALRRGNVEPWFWLTPMYCFLGLTGLILQLWIYQRVFSMPMRRAWKHFPVAMILLVVVACVGAAALALPLRMWLEQR